MFGGFSEESLESVRNSRVENVLWRMENGELDFRVTPKAVVVFVGTNNVDCSPESIFGGIRKLVETVKGKLGDVPVVLPVSSAKLTTPPALVLVSRLYCPKDGFRIPTERKTKK